MPGSIKSLFTSVVRAPQVRAELIGDDTCTAQGITSRGYSPILDLCRELLAAGADPLSQLDAYRDGILALHIDSIGQAARLTVKSAGNGAPIFALDSRCRGAGAPPIAPSERTGARRLGRSAIAGAAP